MYLRHPRTAQEQRANQDGWCRPSRRPKNLVDSRDDIKVLRIKNWKLRRRNQYRPVHINAGVAQLAEPLACIQAVVGSTPSASPFKRGWETRVRIPSGPSRAGSLAVKIPDV